jgi:hypothetical protein
MAELSKFTVVQIFAGPVSASPWYLSMQSVTCKCNIGRIFYIFLCFEGYRVNARTNKPTVVARRRWAIEDNMWGLTT